MQIVLIFIAAFNAVCGIMISIVGLPKSIPSDFRWSIICLNVAFAALCFWRSGKCEPSEKH